MYVDRTVPRNIVIFGQTGAGKSSIINMLAGSPLAKVSGGASGCTPSSKCYSVRHGDDIYTLWDTAGLNEADDGTVSSQAAVQNLLDLVKDHGVNLLVYCIRERFPNIIRVNYDLFWGIICRKEVPILLVVTGLEGKEDMDDWWYENQKTIKKMKMSFDGHACITSWKGRGNRYEKEYQQSAERVWKLVRKHCRPNPWSMPPDWPTLAQREIKAYEQNYYNAGSANGVQKFLRQLSFLFSLWKTVR